MDKFLKLFGMESCQIRENCLLLPCLPKGILELFQIKTLTRGKLFRTANRDDLTLIHTGIGAGFVGDAVLYLQQTSCKNILLFGSCGAIPSGSKFSLGDLVTPAQCYSYESFSGMLTGQPESKSYTPQNNLFPPDFFADNPEIKPVIAATVSSLKLEETYGDIFIKQGIEVVDMECSAFFSAANLTGAKVSALLYISDIIGDIPFYFDPTQEAKQTINATLKKAADLICRFTKPKPND